MKLNYEKTKVMICNRRVKYDVTPKIEGIKGRFLEVVE